MNTQRQTFSSKIKDSKIEFYDRVGSAIWLELLNGKDVLITIERETKKRTSQQNRALHKYFELLAEELNDAGLDVKEVLRPSVDIEWTGELIKEYIWRPVQMAQLKKKSTTQLTTSEIDQIYEVITRHLGQKFGLYVPFPSEENPAYQ
jgi:hypothetical protein